MRRTISSWEPYTRGAVPDDPRVHVFTARISALVRPVPASGGRRAAIPMALDGLPAVFGTLEIAGGLLLFARTLHAANGGHLMC